DRELGDVTRGRDSPDPAEPRLDEPERAVRARGDPTGLRACGEVVLGKRAVGRHATDRGGGLLGEPDAAAAAERDPDRAALRRRDAVLADRRRRDEKERRREQEATHAPGARGG